MVTSMKPTLEMKEIDKSFTGVHALNKVSFCCYPGTVHVLQGENGAGKSTLLKIISGLYQADSGEMYLNGERVNFRHPMDSRRMGIAMVYQEMTILPHLTVAQNIFLNQEERLGGRAHGLLDEYALVEKTRALAGKYGIEIDPYATAGDIPIAQQQIVEILKALASDPQILILDEPTSTLTRTEVDKLYSIVNELKQQGRTILFISHRMEEVLRFGDDMTVLKDGCLVGTVKVKDVTEDDIITMMVGRKLEDIFPPKPQMSFDEVVFRAENIADHTKVHGVTLEIRKGEVLGFSALDGQGQTELMQILSGNRSHAKGRMFLNEKEIKYKSPRAALKQGVGYVPEDRKWQALCLQLSVRENVALASMNLRQKLGFVLRRKELETVNAQVRNMNIRTPSVIQLVGNLSGGNQQKVSVGKSLAAEPKVLFLNEPTRGIDVEAKQEIYRLIRKLADEGVAVAVYSSDLMEVIGLSDRVLTIYEGRITAELTGDDINEESIMAGAMNLCGKAEGVVSE